MRVVGTKKDFAALLEEAQLLVDTLSDLLAVREESFAEFMQNTFLALIALPLARGVEKGGPALFALHILVARLRPGPARDKMMELFLAERLPPELLAFPPPALEPPGEFTTAPLFELTPAVRRHLEALFDRLLGSGRRSKTGKEMRGTSEGETGEGAKKETVGSTRDGKEKGGDAEEESKTSIPSFSSEPEVSTPTKKTPSKTSNPTSTPELRNFPPGPAPTSSELRLFREISRLTGVIAFLPGLPSVPPPPLSLLLLPRASPNDFCFQLLGLLVTARPSPAPPLALAQLIDTSESPDSLVWLGSEPALFRLGLAIQKWPVSLPGRPTLAAFFRLIDSIRRRVPNVDTPLLEQLRLSARPFIQFFVDFDLSRGLAKLASVLEEEFTPDPPFPPYADPSLLETVFLESSPPDDPLRLHAKALRGLAEAAGNIFPSPEAKALTSHFEDFYSRFKGMEYLTDHSYDMAGLEFYKMKLKLKINGVSVKKLCYLHLAEANLVIVQNLGDQKDWANVLISAKYKFIKIELAEGGKLMVIFSQMKNCLVLYFESQEMAQKVAENLKEATKKCLLDDLSLFSAKLLNFKKYLALD